MSLIPPATRRSEPARWARLRWASKALLGLVLTAWSLVLIAWLTLHWGILPHIQQWREPIEQRASAALGVPVRIGRIEVRSGGWVPSFELREVQLLDAAGRPALRLPRVFAAISPRSLLSLELRFEQLLIDGAQLEVRRDAAGRISVGGLTLDGAGGGGGSDAADWFFAQHEFVIRGGALRWTDELRGADTAPLALTDVQLVLRNGLRLHELRVDATPPPEWGDRFSASGRFTQPLLARRGDWRRWSGSAYADLPRADVHALRAHVRLPFELSEGVGALRGWLDVERGEPVGATVDLALRAVALRLAPNVEPLAINEVEGRLVARRDADGTRIALQRFTFETTGDEIRWPQGDMSFAWQQRDGQPATGGAFSAQRLDIALMARLAQRVPLGEPVRKWLADLDPKGQVTELTTSWDGPLDAPRRYKAHAKVGALALAAHAASEPRGVGRPGLRGASVQFDATEAGGSAQLAINGGALELPGVFDEPLLVLDRLAAQLQWKIEPAKDAGAPPRLSLQVKDARFANADAAGELTANWSTGAPAANGRGAGRFPGRLELDGTLSDGAAQRVYRYLPLGLPKATRDYLERAVQDGRIPSASYRVRGDLAEFPFFGARAAKDSEFRINAKIEDTRFAFVPSTPATAGAPAVESAWPVLTQTSVDLALDRNLLELRNGRTRIGGIDFPRVQVAIRKLDSEPELVLDGNGSGPLGEMLRIVNSTPISGWTSRALATGSATGAADLALNLTIPLQHVDTTAVKGSVTLAGNDVRISADSPLLGAAKGRVDFTHKGFAIVGASAKVYGGDATFDGGTQSDGSVRVNGAGTIAADALRRAPELSALARLAGSLAGQTSYRASLGFGRGAEINVTSNLVGLAINLPAPLAKAAETPLALRVSTAAEPGSGAPPARDVLRIELGSVVQAQYVRDVSGEQPRVLRGGIGVMAPPPSVASGVAAVVELPLLATDDWQAVADKLGDEPAAGAAANASTATSPYAPDTVALRVQELVAGQRRLTHVSAGLSQEGGVWRASVDADQLDGYLEYRVPTRRGGGIGGRVYARLARLSLPKGDDEQVEKLLDQQPATMPALDVVVDDFELRGKRLGRVEIEAVNRARDWQLSKFNLITPEARLTATGQWSAAGPGPRAAARRMTMDFKLQVADSGALLDRLGTRGAVRGGKGALSGQIGWAGSPFALDYPSLSGQVNVAVDSGQFLKVDPGAARLLGVLSLQSLPRRLSLDFRDLFQEGFAFDSLSGDVTIAQGVAKTNNLRMRGVQALVLMEGSADIEHETQDLRVVVVPEINAGTAALAYAVINPAIGLGAFLAQALLKKPLTAAGTREFQVSGPWADPKVERVERKLGEDALAVEPAASAPSGK